MKLLPCYKYMKSPRTPPYKKTSISTAKGLCCDATNLKIGYSCGLDSIYLLLYPQDDQN
jgi:hypothetical protein